MQIIIIYSNFNILNDDFYLIIASVNNKIKTINNLWFGIWIVKICSKYVTE